MGNRFFTNMTLLAIAGLTASACAPSSGLSPGFKSRMEEFEEDARGAVARAMERQVVPAAAVAYNSSSVVRYLEPGSPIWIQSGKSQVVRLPAPAKRVSIGDPDIAGIVVLGPDTIIVNGKTLSDDKTEEQLLAESGVAVSQGGVVIGRTLTRPPRFAETTLIVWGNSGVSVHPLIVANFLAQQVMLEVTIAEVNRSALEQHGIDFRVVQEDLVAAGWMAAGIPPGPETSIPPQLGEQFLPLVAGAGGPQYALIFPDENVSAFIRALETEGLATVLARPKLTAMSGQNAVFQVGGEIPIRIVTSFTASIDYKPFGTLVNFLPRVTDNGDIFLTVTPEVSEADFSQTVEDIPTFRTRRASTSAKLRNGETLVISGLLQNRVQEEEAGIPFLKDIPYLGYAFRSTRYSRELVELMIVVKPSIISPLPVGAEVMLPEMRGPLTREDVRTTLSSDAPVTRPRPLPARGEAQNAEIRHKTDPTEATDPMLPDISDVGEVEGDDSYHMEGLGDTPVE